jgi:hypothetical protein
MRTAFLAFILLTALACTSTAPQGPFTSQSPWSQPPLARDAVPAAYVSEWTKAENRDRCALIAPRTVNDANAQPRAATFSGGWAVAYDVPGMRSAFGVAGTGSLASAPAYDHWPHKHAWRDGSHVGYGPEGGEGPNQLAYLTIAGQQCSYNVWSRIGVAHLEQLLRELRFVR